jgi:ribonuclease HI
MCKIKRIIFEDKIKEIGGRKDHATNNQMELTAPIEALKYLKKKEMNIPIEIFSDSKYAIDCITTWAYSWKKNGWSKKGGEIKNLELIIEAHTLYEKLKTKIEINHVKGHAGVEGNELADRMAVYTIKAKNKDFAFYSYNKIEEVLSLTSY